MGKVCCICGSEEDVRYGSKYGIVCNNCSCNLLSIENNVDNKETEEEFVERMRKGFERGIK
jgi:hypothetical protein